MQDGSRKGSCFVNMRLVEKHKGPSALQHVRLIQWPIRLSLAKLKAGKLVELPTVLQQAEKVGAERWGQKDPRNPCGESGW